MDIRNTTIHAATPNTSFATLANALAAIFHEQGTRVSPAIWDGDVPRQICLAPFVNDIAFSMYDMPSPRDTGIITQSWADLLSEVEAEMAEGGIQQLPAGAGLTASTEPNDVDESAIVLPVADQDPVSYTHLSCRRRG